MKKKKRTAGRKPLYTEAICPYNTRLKQSQIVWLRQQENAAVWLRDLIDEGIAKAGKD